MQTKWEKSFCTSHSWRCQLTSVSALVVSVHIRASVCVGFKWQLAWCTESGRYSERISGRSPEAACGCLDRTSTAGFLGALWCRRIHFESQWKKEKLRSGTASLRFFVSLRPAAGAHTPTHPHRMLMCADRRSRWYEMLITCCMVTKPVKLPELYLKRTTKTLQY